MAATCKKYHVLFFSLVLISGAAAAQTARTVFKPNPGQAANSGSVAGRQQLTSSCAADTIILTSQAQIDNFTTTYPACTTPKYLFIDGSGASPAITNLNGLSSLTQVINKLIIKNTAVTSLAALNTLTLIGDTLEISHNPAMASCGLTNLSVLGGLILNDLPSLTSIAGISNNITSIGSIHIDSTGITDLSGLSNIEHVNNGSFTELRISNCPVTNLAGFSSLNTILGYLIIENNPSLSSVGITTLTDAYGFLFSNLPNLSTIAGLSNSLTNTNIGTFWMSNTGLTNLTGLDSLTGSSNFYITGNNNLNSLQGLNQLTGNIDGGIVISGNNILNNLTALSNITSTDNGTLELSYNNNLTGLGGLGNIINIGGGLRINDNPIITTLAALNSALIIQNNNLDSVRIYNNPLLSACSLPPLCTYLAGSGGAEIYNNAAGCSSIAEVVSNCTTTPDQTWNGSVNNNWDEINNWTPSGIPTTSTKVIIPSSGSVPNTPVAQGNLTIGGLVMQNGSELDMNSNTLNMSKTFVLDNASIFSAAEINAIRIYMPSVKNSYLEGDFNCTDYGGLAEFLNNNFQNNTLLSDSTGRTAISTTANNTFNGNLSFINNSNFGNNYLANVSGAVDYVEGNLSITNNATAAISIGLASGRPLKVQGDLIINSSSGLVDINNLTLVGGTFNPSITQLGSNRIKINNLFLESGAETRLNQPVEINNSLVFDNGSNKINTTSSNLLILNNGATVIRDPANSRGFINGPMKKKGNQAFTFPLGMFEQQTDWYAPLTISAPTSVIDEFTAEYFHHNPGNEGYDTALYSPGFGGISGKEYWKLDRNNGSSNVSVTLAYDSARSGVAFLFNDMQVAGWNGSLWNSLGSGGFTGNIASGTLLSGIPLTTYGPVTFSFKPIRKPIITIGTVIPNPCTGVGFNVPFSLDTLMIAGNRFDVQLSDSLGVFHANNTIIGTKLSISSDTIIATLPGSLNYGSNYKIRVVGDLPRDTSVNEKTVIPSRIPQQTFDIIGPVPACIGNGVQKYYPSIIEANTTYSWTLSGGGTFTTNADTAIVTWTTTGTYNLTCSSSNHCGAGPQKIQSIEVRPPAPTEIPTINNTGRWLYSSQAPALANYQWYRNGVLISGATNAAYYASLSGDYTIRFSNYCGSGPASNQIFFGANALPQTINFPAIGTKTYGDAPFVPAATATSGLPVSFLILSGPATIHPQTNVLTITGTGSVTIRAMQPGNNLYDTAAFVQQSFTINKALQTITFSAIADQNFGNAPVALNATSTSGLPITYSIVSGPATVSGNLATLTGLGTITIRASQAGDTNYLPATAVDRSFCTNVATLNHITGYTNLCPGTATYTTNNIPGATYLWRIAGGATLASTTHSAIVNWTTPGTYSLIVSASGSCGAPSANDTLVVNVINSIQPDSVHGMLPVNGAINQQLPLTLSWIPAQPNLFYTFDLYLWRADTAQPATPYATNLTTVNYTIPISSGLLSNQLYKWMVVAHNGSCTMLNTGPIQTFTLIPLPDLIVQNVQIPSTAFSGQTIAINWTVKNIGPGHTSTNQNWTDAIFLSFDTIPNFTIPPNTNPAAWSLLEIPLRPLLVGTRQNLSALDSGQQYSNSANFTLPLNYSQPLYAYVITNFPAGNNAPQQVTKINDTARAPQPVVVTLSPTPDLRVDTVFASNTVFSGSTVNVTYKVKNYGVVTPAGSTWTDKFYISQSSIFNINTATLLKLPKPNGTYYWGEPDATALNNVQLLPDSTYTRSINIVIPNFISGSYFLHVVTNATASLYEGAAINNNTNFKQVQVFLTPTPHLTISSLTVPVTTASTTQPIGVNWNIRNNGFTDNIEKNKGHYIVPNGSCGAGMIAMRDSLGQGSSFWTDRVYLSTDSTGLVIANAVLVNETAHGIQNSGNNSSEILLQFPCQPAGYNTSQHNQNTSNVIVAAANYPKSGNFTIPSNLPAGNYFVYVFTNPNKTVYEYPGNNEIRRSVLPISIQRPDAVVSSVTVPANTIAGQSFVINYSILNNGPGSVLNHLRRDKIFVSTSPVFDASAQLITTQTFTENLTAGNPVPHTCSYTFPANISGNRYFYVHTNFDSTFRETNQNNNISTAAATNVSLPNPCDLQVTAVPILDTVSSIFATRIKYTVTNSGPGTTAGTWKDSIFISCNPVYNVATSYFIGVRSHTKTIATGNSYVDSFLVNLPFSFNINNCFPTTLYNTAYFFVKTNADTAVYEGANTNNNVSGSGSRVLFNPLVDHIVTQVTVPDTMIAGRIYPASWTVKNIGYKPDQPNYNFWYDQVYYSPDSVFNSKVIAGDISFRNLPLNNNQSYTESKNIYTPSLTTGDYYVHVKTNFTNLIPGEINNSNNTNLYRNGAGVAKKIHVIMPLLPDLKDSILTAPPLVSTGQPITIVHKVTNAGAGVTYPANWSDDVWLSTDFIPGNTGDIRLIAKNRSGNLLPGEWYNDTLTGTIGLNVPAGNYILISRTNASNNVLETNLTNNVSFRYITVVSPVPSDLIVENIMKPDTAILGYSIDTAKWVIKNISTNTAAGVSADGIYFSKTNVLDSTAVLMGIKNKNISMGPLAMDTITFNPIINDVTEGNYHIIVKTDLLNNIVESNKNNNTAVSATRLYVKVTELPMNLLTANTLFTVNRYYKLIIPDSLSGSTIQVVLKSSDSLTMKNQMFIGKGYVPSAAQFDYTFSTPNYGNQEIIMTSATTGTYYITIRNVSASPVNQNITLKAVKLPFAVFNVHTASGGNIGNVTVKINGSLFITNMTAKLTKPGTTIQASAIYYTNSTTVFATFNLQGRPLGIYDVTLTKPDSSTAVLTNGFSVVNANNGGLNTGGGTNTGPGNGNAPGCDPGAAAGINSQLVTEIVAPAYVFSGWTFTIQINYNNPTNVDVPAQVRMLYNDHELPMAFSATGLNPGSTSLVLELTEPGGPPGIIRAGGSGTVTVYCRVPLSVPGHTVVKFSLQ